MIVQFKVHVHPVPSVLILHIVCGTTSAATSVGVQQPHMICLAKMGQWGPKQNSGQISGGQFHLHWFGRYF